MVPLGAVGQADVTSCLPCLLSGHRLRWTLNVPACFSADDLHLTTSPESLLDLLSPRRPRMLLALPQTQLRASAGYSSVGVGPLMERWDHSNLEELEAFIDLHFEMVWEQSMGSPELPELEEQSAGKTGDEDALSSISRKLSKLELLEEIQKELKELRTNVEHSWKLTEELREHKHHKNST